MTNPKIQPDDWYTITRLAALAGVSVNIMKLRLRRRKVPKNNKKHAFLGATLIRAENQSPGIFDPAKPAPQPSTKKSPVSSRHPRLNTSALPTSDVFHNDHSYYPSQIASILGFETKTIRARLISRRVPKTNSKYLGLHLNQSIDQQSLNTPLTGAKPSKPRPVKQTPAATGNPYYEILERMSLLKQASKGLSPAQAKNLLYAYAEGLEKELV